MHDKIFQIDLRRFYRIPRHDDNHIWGEEFWMVNHEQANLALKALVFDPGYWGSEHRHKTKREIFLLAEGEIYVELLRPLLERMEDRLDHWWQCIKAYLKNTARPIWNDNRRWTTFSLEIGESLYIHRMRWHRIKNISQKQAVIIEVSSFEDEKTMKKEGAAKIR